MCHLSRSLLDAATKCASHKDHTQIATNGIPPAVFSVPAASSNHVRERACPVTRLNFFRRHVEAADAAAGTRHDPPVSVAHGAKSVAAGSAIRAAGRSAHPALEGTTARQSDAAHCRHGSCRSHQAWFPAKFSCIAHLQPAICVCPYTSIFILASPVFTVSGLSVHAQCRRNSLFRGYDCHRAIALQFFPRSRESRCCKSHIGAHRLHTSPGLVAFPLKCREFVCLPTQF
jgi:hypothetical protein